MISRKTVNSLLISAVTLTIGSAAASAQAHEPPADSEKCYGVAKAGGNDCANAAGTHDCAGHAATDGAGDEWVAVPQGLCEKLVGGSLTPIAAATPKPQKAPPKHPVPNPD